MKYPFVFIDESGTADSQKNRQPYSGFGFLKINETENITTDLLRTHFGRKGTVKRLRKEATERIVEDKNNPNLVKNIHTAMLTTSYQEYHFSEITKRNLDSYKKFIESCRNHKFDFYAIILKRDLNIPKVNYWDIYQNCIQNLCRHYINEKKEKCILIADNCVRRKNDLSMTEKLLNPDLNLSIANLLVTESIGQPLIQLCDLILGSLVFLYKYFYKKDLINEHSISFKAKMEFTYHLVKELKFNDINEIENLIKQTNYHRKRTSDRNIVIWEKYPKKGSGFENIK